MRIKVGSAISGTLGTELLLLEVLCRPFGSLQLVFQQNGHKFRAHSAISTVLQHTDLACNQRNNQVNLKLLRAVVNFFTLNSALCKPVCDLVQQLHRT
jgi:hypothetical protein